MSPGAGEGSDTLEDSFAAMVAAVQAFHDKHDFRSKGGEELVYRVALMSEELGEISAAVTKGKPPEALAEEVADLMILVLGTAISADFDLGAAFWAKMNKLLDRRGRMVNGRIRVSEFRGAATGPKRKAKLGKATVVEQDQDWGKATMQIHPDVLMGTEDTITMDEQDNAPSGADVRQAAARAEALKKASISGGFVVSPDDARTGTTIDEGALAEDEIEEI